MNIDLAYESQEDLAFEAYHIALNEETHCVICGQDSDGLKFDGTNEDVCSLDCLEELKKYYKMEL